MNTGNQAELDASTRTATLRWHRLLRRAGRAVLLFIGLVVVLLALSVVGALRAPGNESFRAKWADWLRDHHAAALVTPLENWYFGHREPPKGGRPEGLNTLPAAAPAGSTNRSGHLPRPVDVALVVQPGLTDEGRWQPQGPPVDGSPGMYVAQFRADDVYTGELTTAVWMDPSLLRLRVIPGEEEPGGTWPVPPAITGDGRRDIVAAFNGGFRFAEAHGGFWFGGTEAVPLQDRAASILIGKDGHVALGVWNRDVTLDANTEAVLQNLSLLVDGGQVDPSISHNDTNAWGATLKGEIAVARSGVGITADGALIYVAGPALTAKTLAESLQRAGAVRAMALDLNPEWVTFNFYEHPDPTDAGVVSGIKLYPEMERPADRYLGNDSRDFFTVSSR